MKLHVYKKTIAKISRIQCAQVTKWPNSACVCEYRETSCYYRRSSSQGIHIKSALAVNSSHRTPFQNTRSYWK